MKLESFDKNGEVYSALKIDTIIIVVLETEPEPEPESITFPFPTFIRDPLSKAIISGEEVKWTLPPIDEGESPMQEVILKPDALIVDYITLIEDKLLDTFTVSYNGTAIVDLKTKTFVSVDITLVNDFGSNNYTQNVVIWPASAPTEPLPLEELSETKDVLDLTEDLP